MKRPQNVHKMTQNPAGDRESAHLRSHDLVSDRARIGALQQTGLLDAATNEAFDRLTRLAAKFLDTPVSLVTLVAEDRQFILSQNGLPDRLANERAFPLEYSYCRYALDSPGPLLIEDARDDPRVSESPAITENVSIAYAGIPLMTEGGHVLGTLCVIDHEPRSWTEEEVAVLRDLAASVMTEVRVRAESLDILRQRERRFRALIEQSAEIIAVVDREARVRYISPGVERLLGYDRHGEARSLLEVVHPEDLEAARTALEEVIRRKPQDPPASVELRCRHQDGSYRWLHTVSTNLLEEPSVAGIVTNSQDVTELRRSEEQLRHAQKMEAVGRLAGGIAHDFNNLLTSIGGFVDLALDQLPSTHPSRADLEQALRSGRRAEAITRQLLTFSRRDRVERKTLDLNRQLLEIEPLVRRLVGEDIQVLCRPAARPAMIHADPVRIDQVIMNLVINASDAMPSGGDLTISIDTHDLEESVTGSQGEIPAGRYVRLQVMDTGEGIPPELRERILEPFFTTKASGKGTGLGLSTVWAIVQENNGYLHVYSEPGEGACFRIYLPRAEAVALEQAVDPEPVDDSAPSATILVVEDEEGVRALVRRVLERVGYEVLLAADPEEAEQAVEDHEGPLHLLLTDVVMPGGLGTTLATRLHASRPDLRILFTSGYSEERLAGRGVFAQTVNFLEKPFTPQRLVRKVREVLRQDPENQRAPAGMPLSAGDEEGRGD